jgi:hypothetical protein
MRIIVVCGGNLPVFDRKIAVRNSNVAIRDRKVEVGDRKINQTINITKTILHGYQRAL